ncbi:MAG: lipase family protein, partial [Novosphingobium sp.]
MTNEFEYTLCVLASAAYDQTAQTTLGFKVLATFGDPSTAGGFYAVAFFDDDDNNGVCDNGERIIVSFRGTDVGTSLDDAAADLAIGLPTAAWHSQFNQAISTVLGLRQSHQASEILVTGHSLGGSLAQVAAHAFSLGGAAFDPGGAANLVASSDYQTLMTSLDADPQNDGISFGQGPSSDFRNFFVIGSFVSGSSGAHIGSNSVTLDFATQAQGNVVAVTVSGVNRFFDVLGTEATWLAEAVVNFLPTFVYHGIGGIRSLMSIRAGGAFDTASDLYAQIANITNYASTTGNIGFDSPPGSAVNPTYTLSASRPILIADNGDNQINGTSGNDTIYALGGDDIINSGTGVDRVDGGAGFDTVSADQSTASAVIIWNLLTNSYSGPGSYSAIERFGTLRTGSGNDRITTADFGVRDNIFTGAGDDVVTLDGGGDYAMGGEGDDTLELDFSWRSGSVTVRTTAPPLQVFGVPGGSANAAGMVQAYFAEFENYTISTGSGNDYIRTDAGHDEIRAGDGNDDIGAGAGDD